jgi:5-methylthioadenosine/S-adenosylhomocysteine deaminase
MPLDELMDMATFNGARALGLDSGRIEAGRRADLCLVDTQNTFFLSPAPFLANLVYSSHSDCIRTVIAGGRIVMKDRVVPGEKEILAGAAKVLKQLKQ